MLCHPPQILLLHLSGSHIIVSTGIIFLGVNSNSLDEVVPGYEGDYQYTPSPESPEFSPITPRKYVLY